MVAEYVNSARNQGLAEDEMHAVVGDLIAVDQEPGEEFEREMWKDFDVAAVGMGFHHFPDPGLAASRLVNRLRVGGVLFIVDFLPHGDHAHAHSHGNDHNHAQEHVRAHPHDHSHGHDHGKEGGEKLEMGEGNAKGKGKSPAETVIHHGFTEGEIKQIFVDAGAGKDFEYVVLGKGIVFSNQGVEQRRSLFIARGTKG
jgi:SAM-dependent methyltransferase